MKRLTICCVFTLFCLLVPVSPRNTLTASARQDQNPPFTVQTIVVKNMPAYNMLVSPDGRIAALYAGESVRQLLNIPIWEYTVEESLLPIRLIDLTTGTELGQLRGYTDYVGDIAFTPDGLQLASYHLNGDLYLWDIASMRPTQHITAIIGHEKAKFLPDGKTLVTYMSDASIGQFLLWNVETGYITDVWRASYTSLGDLHLSEMPDRFNYTYTTFDISPDGTLLATATANDELMLWDTATLQQTLVHEIAPEDSRVQFNIRPVTFSADNKTLVYFDSATQQTHFWDIASGTETTALSIGSPSFGLSPHNDALAWTTRKELWFVDLNHPDQATKVLDFPGDVVGTGWGGRPAVTFTPDGSRMVVGGFGSLEFSQESIIYVITLN